MKYLYQLLKFVCLMSKVTAPQDAHRRLVLQVYLGLNTSEFSAIHIGEIFVSKFRNKGSLLLSQIISGKTCVSSNLIPRPQHSFLSLAVWKSGESLTLSTSGK